MNKKQRYLDLIQAIEEERKSEELYYKALADTKSINQRLDSGFLWWSVQINRRQFTVGDLVEVEIERVRNLDEPHKLKVGAGVRLFKEGREHDYIGVISFLRRNKLRILFKDEKVLHDNDIQYGQVGVELMYDERPYRIMKQAIDELLSTDNIRLAELRDGIATNNFTDHSWEGHSYTLKGTETLNESQKNAVTKLKNCGDIGIIHGPPGTGKTTTIVSLIETLVTSEKKILVCAPSNNAVDLLAELISSKGIPVLRIGNISRISDDLIHLSLAEKIRDHADWKHIKKVRIEADEALKLANQHKRKFGQEERNERRAMRREAKELRKWARELEDRLVDLLIDEAKVICTTLIGASAKSINKIRYSTLIIDEASQALEPECWNAMLKAKRTILAGDHMQLSPVVKSNEAVKLGLDKTLLDVLSGKIKHDYLLDTQYRMHADILSFSNGRFYENKLKSHTSVENHKIPEDQKVVQFIDTSGCGFYEEFDEQKRSYKNSQEFLILREYLITQREKQLPYSIGIIAPYASQVNYIRDEIAQDEVFEGLQVEVDTVDGFQGQEKDVIYISLVRSNDQGQIGFLKDERRLNVAMTRARKKLVLIGDITTLSSSPLFNSLADHVESNDFYRSAWEFMAY